MSATASTVTPSKWDRLSEDDPLKKLIKNLVDSSFQCGAGEYDEGYEAYREAENALVEYVLLIRSYRG